MVHKICFIDFDGTLVRPNGNRPFPINADDFRLLFPIEHIKNKLQEVADMGFKLIIRSDQTKQWKYTMITTVKKMITDGTSLVIDDIISWNKLTNKPCTKLVEQTYPLDNIHIGSIMIGDAAGRHGDWSSVDKDFANRLGIVFYTPEEFFGMGNSIITEVNYTKNIAEIVLMVGLPGSGKSTFIKNHLQDYFYISGDTLKTQSKIAKSIREVLKNQISNRFVIDACNHTVEKRSYYKKLSIELGLEIRIIWIDVSREKAISQNELRKDTDGYLPKVAIYTLAKNFQEPTINEDIEFITI